MTLSTVLAKALFDNVAESAEELAFRKGDILMVLEQDSSGPGWWLCSLHGRQGIAPANRLRLLNTSQPCPAPNADPASAYLCPSSCPATRPAAEDSVYLSPGPVPRVAQLEPPAGGDVGEGVYLSPPSLGAPPRGEGRPRTRSSSSSRPRPDWEVGVTGRARSPSLRGRGADAGTPKHQSLYQTPPSPIPAATQPPGGYPNSRGGPLSESVYLAPSGIPRVAPEGPAQPRGAETDTYLVPREAVGVGNSEGCYLVPRVTVMPSEEVYQTPTGGGAVAGPAPVTPAGTGNAAGSSTRDVCPTHGPGPKKTPLPPSSNGVALLPQAVGQEAPGLYQTPSLRGGLPKTPQNERKLPREGAVPSGAPSPAGGSVRHTPTPAQGSPRPQGPPGAVGKAVPPTPPGGRGKLPQASVRNSPVLPRAGRGRVQGSPNFARKPPPPAPPVRGVTKKDTPPSVPPGATSNQEGQKDGRMEEENKKTKKKVSEEGEYEEPDDEILSNQVYDTPPTSRWQHTVAPAACEDDSIYNTPRVLPPQADQGSEVYDVPTLPLAITSGTLQETYSIPAALAVGSETEEDVYSVPSLPGLSVGPSELSPGSGGEVEQGQLYSVPGSGRRADMVLFSEEPHEGAESECGIYDMPALTVDAPTSSTRRSSVSSTSSGDVQWRSSLSALIQSALNSTSLSATSRDLATSLADILSVWKASQESEAPLPVQQAWSRLSDLLPALSVGSSSPPSEALLSLVRRALEDSASLLQSQAVPALGRPRLPSQESLSRRPLPALPVAEVKPLTVGMGGRKGSWIQERPLPPPPPPSFPLPPAPPQLIPTNGQPEEEDFGNEYAGIGLTATPPPTCSGADSGGYVKLQGKLAPSVPIPTENTPPPADPPSAEQRSSPSPPLPVSLSLEDLELLSFYSTQSLSHLSCLANSIEDLFTSVQGNKPPRDFVSRGKSLIVTAHKLVFIGDTLSRLLSSPDLRAKVTTSGGRLCQALKAVVVATKGAAQNYPSVPATQEMVDRVAELSQHAAGFSTLLQRLADIS
ncbi:embryonal Fyn-associated substrate [Megalops cyprinoides]|uniref:embryonal Fyn-associated substrate n=1 Tax=Megalops cyprinoides TaxID=118141 RepID=UPI0018645F37|nr:embryonal Fyn-associated substrate [Megalops cyprinoides]